MPWLSLPFSTLFEHVPAASLVCLCLFCLLHPTSHLCLHHPLSVLCLLKPLERLSFPLFFKPGCSLQMPRVRKKVWADNQNLRVGVWPQYLSNISNYFQYKQLRDSHSSQLLSPHEDTVQFLEGKMIAWSDRSTLSLSVSDLSFSMNPYDLWFDWNTR